MTFRADEDRLIVVSDLHLGNPFCRAKNSLVEFLKWVCDQEVSLCINGDGLDIMQTSLVKLAQAIPEVFHQFRRIMARGCCVYYTIGNHDIVLEHLLDAWGGLRIVPFLNVHSGEKRIRIEHGHLYDPFYVKKPMVYEGLGKMAGYALQVVPDLYRIWAQYEEMRSRRHLEDEGIPGEAPAFFHAAETLMSRGFDAVVLGHTHHVGSASRGDGKVYVNAGSWLLEPHFVFIENGEISVDRWSAVIE